MSFIWVATIFTVVFFSALELVSLWVWSATGILLFQSSPSPAVGAVWAWVAAGVYPTAVVLLSLFCFKAVSSRLDDNATS